MKSNQVFSGMLRQIKLNDKDVTKHKLAVNYEDWQKLSDSEVLTTSTPQGLQKMVFIDIMLHLRERVRRTNGSEERQLCHNPGGEWDKTPKSSIH